MRHSRITTVLSTLAATLILGAGAANAAADPQANWNEIHDLLQKDSAGVVLSAPQFVKNGQAHVNVLTGRIHFEVKRLPVKTEEFGSEYGFDGMATQVKGTLVCKVSAGAGATLVDTPVVPLTEEGSASFTGQVSLPSECATSPNDVAFFLRTVQNDGSRD